MENKEVKKTAMMELIEYVENNPITSNSIIQKANELLEKEREQLEEFYDEGWVRGYYKKNYDSGKAYYNTSYKG